MPNARGSSRLQRLAARLADLRGPDIRRSPTILQMENVECGAASLAMILAYHGRWVPLEQLRQSCGVSRDGSKASSIVKAAQEFGLAARGFKKEPAGLGDLPMPCIIHWNFNHFVVLDGLNERFAYLNDPARGRRRVALDEFSQSFTGVALAFEPTEAFRRGGRPPAVLPIAIRVLSSSRQAAWLLLAVSASLVVPGLLVPTFSRIFVDDVLVRGAQGWLWPLLVGLGLTAVARALITLLQQSLLLRLETKISVAMTTRFLWRVLSLPMGFFHQRHAGDIAARVDANEVVTRLLSGVLATNALDVITVLFFAAAMAAYNAGLAAICIAIALLNVLAVAVVARRRDELNRSLTVEQGKLAATTVGIIRTIETLKASGLEDDAFGRWAGRQALVLEAERRLGLYEVIGNVGPPFFAAVTTAVILGLGGLQVIHGAMTLGALVAFQSLMASFSAPTALLVQSAGQLLTAKSNLIRLEDVFNYPLEPAAPAEIAGAARLSGRLEIADLTFRYGPLDPTAIEGFQLTLEPGMRVALVGASGSGKSTLGRLIAGLHQPVSGEIRFDGVRRSDIPAQVFAGSVAYVDQDVFLFEGELRDNLTLWDSDVAEADVVQALKDAAIYDDVCARPGGLDTEVREGGANFSGGQKQRLEIARALVGNPAVLILDEATAALDPATEKTIDDNLRRRGCTCIIIAHRLSTIRDCDEIVVLDQGRIVERGDHSALAAADGAYARMVALG
jgi:NHLM bacteriocin system ABC transporter peptidase/ATP-binding protein